MKWYWWVLIGLGFFVLTTVVSVMLSVGIQDSKLKQIFSKNGGSPDTTDSGTDGVTK